MISVEIGLVDTKKLVDPEIMAATVAALNIQITQHLRQYWSIAPAATVRLLSNSKPMPLGVWPMMLVEKLKENEGGFHSNAHNQPYAKVAVTPHSNDWTIDASHEALEMLVDPSGNRLQVARAISLADGQIRDDAGEFEYLLEICDPCEAYSYQIGGVKVSDFITPEFYEDKALPGGRYSFAGSIKAPRRILPGGYITWINQDESEIQQMIWLDPSVRPKTRSVGKVRGANIRELVDSETHSLAKAAPKWPFRFKIEPGKKTPRSKIEPEHWVTYHQDGKIKIEEWDEDGRSKTHAEHVTAGKSIRRPAGTHHAVENLGDTKLTGDKDLIDPG